LISTVLNDAMLNECYLSSDKIKSEVLILTENVRVYCLYECTIPNIRLKMLKNTIILAGISGKPAGI
jgi:hypothetical protein